MRWQDAPTDPYEDTRRLVEELIPAAQLLLERFGEILPMGALIGPEGEIEQVPCSEGIYETNVLAQAELLRQAFARRAEEGELRASALIYEPGLAAADGDRTAGPDDRDRALHRPHRHDDRAVQEIGRQVGISAAYRQRRHVSDFCQALANARPACGLGDHCSMLFCT